MRAKVRVWKKKERKRERNGMREKNVIKISNVLRVWLDAKKKNNNNFISSKSRCSEL